MFSLPAIQSYQQGPRTVHATSAHGFGHGVSNITRKGFPFVVFVPDVFPPCQLGRGLRAPGPFRPVSHRRAATSTAAAVSRVRKFSRCASGAYSMTHKPLSQSLAYRDRVHFNRLSSVQRLAGFNTSEASNGRVPKPTRAFPEKKGELPNVCC